MKKVVLKNTGIGLVFLLLTPSCKVTKDYARPELNIPTGYESALVTNDSSVVEVPSYHQFFTDEKLIALMDAVMANNLDLQIAAENILATEAILKSVKLNYLPDINLQVNSGLQRLSKNSMMGSFAGGLLFEEYNFAPSVSWDIDFWGKLKRQREEAISNYFSQAENRRALRVQLVGQTAQSYYNLLSLDQQLRITQSVLASMKETQDMLKIQYSVGDVTSLAIQQSEAQLAETKALIPEIKASIKAQENALKTLAGSYPGSIERSVSFEKTIAATSLQIGIPTDILKNRPDVKQQELLLQAASARVGIAKTEFYPGLKITAQGGLNAIKASNWFSIPASLFGTAAAAITQPIFNKRNIRSNYERALHLREATVHEFRKSVLKAAEEVSTSLNSLEHIGEQMKEVNNRKAAMNKAIEDAQMLYKYGEATYLEVLTVQQSYFQTELAHILAIQKEINVYIALYKSLGGN